jgi:hypothetical protein
MLIAIPPTQIMRIERDKTVSFIIAKLLWVYETSLRCFFVKFLFLTDQLYLLRGHLVNVKRRKKSNIRKKATTADLKYFCNEMYQYLGRQNMNMVKRFGDKQLWRNTCKHAGAGYKRSLRRLPGYIQWRSPSFEYGLHPE